MRPTVARSGVALGGASSNGSPSRFATIAAGQLSRTRPWLVAASAAAASAPSTHSPHFCAPAARNAPFRRRRFVGGAVGSTESATFISDDVGAAGMTEATMPSPSINLARGACAPNSLTSATIPAHCLVNAVAWDMHERYPGERGFEI